MKTLYSKGSLTTLPYVAQHVLSSSGGGENAFLTGDTLGPSIVGGSVGLDHAKCPPVQRAPASVSLSMVTPHACNRGSGEVTSLQARGDSMERANSAWASIAQRGLGVAWLCSAERGCARLG